MSHQFESGMFVVKPAWHKLGTVVENAPTTDELVKLAGLDWTVSLQPTYSHNPVTGDMQEMDLKAITRDKDGEVYGTVTGTKYVPFQNADSVEFFRPFEQSGLVKFETAGSLYKGKKIWILARIVAGQDEIVKGDVVRRYLLFSNSHDGKSGIKVGLTPIRVECANLLAMAEQSEESKLMRLFHSRRTKDALELVQNIVNTANSSFEATMDQYRALTRKSVVRADIEKYVTKVFYNNAQAESDREKIAREKLNLEIERLFVHSPGNAMQGVAGTAWPLYNATTNYLTFERGRSDEGRLDSNWFGINRAVNSDALKAALAL